jgi:hypothetical protein
MFETHELVEQNRVPGFDDDVITHGCHNGSPVGGRFTVGGSATEKSGEDR